MNNFNDAKTAKKKVIGFKTIIAILMATVLLIGFTAGYYFYHFTKVDIVSNSELMQIIRENGIDATKNVDGKFLTQDEEAQIIVDTLLADDPYRRYFTKEEYQAYVAEGNGDYEGLGIATINNTVFKTIGNSPAMRAGLLKGDVIRAGCIVNGGAENYIPINDADSLDSFLNTIKLDDTVKLKIERNGTMMADPISITKKAYEASYVTYKDNQKMIAFMADEEDNYVNNSQCMPELDNNTAYIGLAMFQGDAAEQFANALEFAKNRGRKKLIIDLCDNGGGKLSILTEIASYVIYNKNKAQTIIAIEESKSAQDNQIRHSYTDSVTSENNYDKQNIEKIVVLANNNTASASECLLLAMLHYGQESIDNNFTDAGNVVIIEGPIGARTYGKGKVQTTFKLKSGAAIKLTTANLYAPDRETSINGVGITTTPENVVSTYSDAIARANVLINA
jgi:carboxyl-terminal processing protease